MLRPPWRNATRTLGLGLAASLTLAPLALLPQAADASGTTGAAEAPAASPITLWAPKKVTAWRYGKQVWTDLGLRVIAQGAPFELWSTRSSTYDDQIATTWTSGTRTGALPAGAMKDFLGLHRFVDLTLTPRNGDPALTMHKAGCLNSWSERVRPDAPATSPYPQMCAYNPYTLGSVQGVQEGWAAPVLTQYRPMHLKAGTYDVTASIAPRYVTALGLDAASATRTFTLQVTQEKSGGYGRASTARPTESRQRAGRVAEPAAAAPTGAPASPADGPRPDLRALPAWGIQVSPNGNYLQFAATVWNAGDSPLVVDGFRQDGQDLMDAYQYFFDADGNQVGYQPVGQMEWDARPTHQHWHFQDFARYSLVKANTDGTTSEVVRSKKEAFCLANTDAADLTVPGADWKPENTDLATSCGDHNSLSIREVLASGWGDTYAQFRAGQSFDLRQVPNGTYYVAVTANPDGHLVESDTTNNQSLREVVIGGKPGARTVQVAQVGVIKETGRYGY